ncbi:MAG: sugar transferase [Chloroflexi bacterium]|nr:sugar transferase [Chloroflexota bacterium]
MADAAAVNLAWAGAWWLRYGMGIGGPVAAHIAYGTYAPWGLVLTGLVLVAFQLEGLYARGRRESLPEALYAVATGTIVGATLFTVLLYSVRPIAQSRLMLGYAGGLIIVAVGLVRWVDILLRRRRIRLGIGVRQVLVIGAGEVGRRVMRNIMARPELGYRIVGFLDDDPAKRVQPIGRFAPLGGTDALGVVLRQRTIDEVIITLPWQTRTRIMSLVEVCEQAGAGVSVVPDLFQMSLNRVDLASLGGIPLIAVRAPVIRGWPYQIKRGLDIGLAAALLLLFSPLLGLVALLVRLESRGEVLFRQSRVGRDGRLFTCFKFRSMVDGADAERERLRPHSDVDGPIFKMREDPRITRVGRVIRRYSIDELPQLFNVLRGDMSLVGPRPPMPTEVNAYAEWHRRRLDIAPGLTGLWQVSGRSDLTFDEMVMLDLFYAENWSLFLDLKILLRTVPTVLRGTGAY